MTETTQPDPNAEWWTTTEVAAFLGVQVGTVSSYRNRGQMPEPDNTVGRTHLWKPSRIIEWHGGRPRPSGSTESGYEQTLDLIQVSTATDSKDAAVELARIAVEAKLAGGAQVTGPVTSVFWHLGEFGTGEEWRLVLSTHMGRFSELRGVLQKNHPWENPEILAVRVVGATPAYVEWMRKVTAESSADHE